MAAVTVCNDFGAQEEEICHYFHLFPICHAVMRLNALILVFFLGLILPSFTFIYLPIDVQCLTQHLAPDSFSKGPT